MPHYDFDSLVIIGRFQPVHNGHQQLIKNSLKRAEKLFIVCGSANQHRSVRNPWTDTERETMLRSLVTDQEQHRIHLLPVADRPFSDTDWANHITQRIHAETDGEHRIGLISADSQLLTRYAKLFPQWQSVIWVPESTDSGTELRNRLFQQPLEISLPTLKQSLPKQVLEIVSGFLSSIHFQELCEEQRFLTQFKQSWAVAPYPPTFVTVDAIVIQNDCVLLVERKNRPGKGLFALPGGFIDQGETLFQGCLRELQEETQLAVPQTTLEQAVRGSMVCDYPFRSARGRTITHVFYLVLPEQERLPEVEGCDDAKQALWVPLSYLNPTTLFEDHYCIIQKMTGMAGPD